MKHAITTTLTVEQIAQMNDGQKQKRIKELLEDLKTRIPTEQDLATINQELPELLKNLTTLDLGYNGIGVEGIKVLVPYLKGTSITTLDVTNNGIGVEGIKVLVPYLKGTSITTLDLGYNGIGDEGIKVLVPYLKGTSITTLDVTNNGIGVEGIKVLAPYLKGTSITILGLWNNKIGVEGIKALAPYLEGTSVTTLNFMGSEIGDEGIKVLVPYLKGTSITTLYLAGNKIGVEGIKALVPYLKGTSITTLDLGHNNFGVEEIKALAPYLEGTSATTLYLAGNKIGVEGAKVLYDILKDNRTIIKLDLDDNNIKINEIILFNIRSLLERNKELAKTKLKEDMKRQEDQQETLPLTTAQVQRRKSSIFRTDMLGQLESLRLEVESVQAENSHLRGELERFAKLEEGLALLQQKVEAIDPNSDVDLGQFQALTYQVMEIGGQVESVSLLVDQRSKLSKEEIAVLDKKIGALAEEFSRAQIADNVASGEKIDIDSREAKEAMALVQGARDLLKNHITNLTELSKEHAKKTEAQILLIEATKEEKAQEYYINIISLLNSVYAASSSVKSGWVKTSRTGKLGTFGTLIKIAGGFSPVASSAITVVGDLVQALDTKMQKDCLIKFSQLCKSPVEMDRVAQNVALALVQSKTNFASDKEFAEDVKRILQAVFSSKITKDHDLVTAFVNAATGKEIGAPALKKVEVLDVYDPSAELKAGYEKVTGQRREFPNTQAEVILVKDASNKFTNLVFGFVKSGITFDKDDKNVLKSNLNEAIKRQAVIDPAFGKFFTKIETDKDHNVVSDADMGKLLQQSLRDFGVIGTNNAVDSLKIKDEGLIKSAVTKFAEELLERSNTKTKGDTVSANKVSQLGQQSQESVFL